MLRHVLRGIPGLTLGVLLGLIVNVIDVGPMWWAVR